MRRSDALARCVAVMTLASVSACAGGGATGVKVARCNAVATAGGMRMDARFDNAGDKPVAHVNVTADFYRNYTFARAHGTADFSPLLDPGQHRDASFDLDAPSKTSGPVMRCSVDSVVYGDGTSAGGS